MNDRHFSYKQKFVKNNHCLGPKLDVQGYPFSSHFFGLLTNWWWPFNWLFWAPFDAFYTRVWKHALTNVFYRNFLLEVKGMIIIHRKMSLKWWSSLRGFCTLRTGQVSQRAQTWYSWRLSSELWRQVLIIV